MQTWPHHPKQTVLTLTAWIHLEPDGWCWQRGSWVYVLEQDPVHLRRDSTNTQLPLDKKLHIVTWTWRACLWPWNLELSSTLTKSLLAESPSEQQARLRRLVQTCFLLCSLAPILMLSEWQSSSSVLAPFRYSRPYSPSWHAALWLALHVWAWVCAGVWQREGFMQLYLWAWVICEWLGSLCVIVSMLCVFCVYVWQLCALLLSACGTISRSLRPQRPKAQGKNVFHWPSGGCQDAHIHAHTRQKNTHICWYTHTSGFIVHPYNSILYIFYSSIQTYVHSLLKSIIFPLECSENAPSHQHSKQ